LLEAIRPLEKQPQGLQSELPDMHQTLLKTQGQDQLFTGKLSQIWMEIQSDYFATNRTLKICLAGMQLARQLITLSWKYVLQLWASRRNDHH
jgi:hypothetical protein